MKKLFSWLMMGLSLFVLSACVAQPQKDFGEIVVQQNDNLVISDKENIVQVSLPKDYIFNGQANIESISYGNVDRETYVLTFAEPKGMIPAQTLQEYFDLITPGLDNIKIEELQEGIIPNPKGYTVKDYKITGSFNDVNLVWFQRILEQDNYFAQFNAWTLDTNLEQNQAELFNDIMSFEWKEGANVVTTEEQEEYISGDSEQPPALTGNSKSVDNTETVSE